MKISIRWTLILGFLCLIWGAYTNRIGITIAHHSYDSRQNTEVERYLKNSNLLTEKKDFLRLDVITKMQMNHA